MRRYWCLSHIPLQWRHNECDGVSNHQPHDCLLNRLFGRSQRKHQSSATLAFVWGIHRSPVNSPHKESVTRKMFPFDDVIMQYHLLILMLVCAGWMMFWPFIRNPYFDLMIVVSIMLRKWKDPCIIMTGIDKKTNAFYVYILYCTGFKGHIIVWRVLWFSDQNIYY